MHTDYTSRVKRANVTQRLLPCLIAILALIVFPIPAYTQADSHEVEITLEVDEDRYRIEVPNLLPPGPTTFHITNNTDVEHNLTMIGESIRPFAIEALTPDETRTIDLELGQGLYLLYSSMLSYAALGMETTFFVTDERINPATQNGSAATEDSDTDSSDMDSTGTMTDTATSSTTGSTTGTTDQDASDSLVAIATDNNLNTLVELLQTTGLTNTLQGEGPYTVFAPTDEAFAALPQETLDQLRAEPAGYLSQVLLYHVVEGDLRAADLSDGQVISTVQGNELVIIMDGDALRVNDATIVTPDIAAGNGVIHTIDGVLLPVSEEGPMADVSEATGAPAMEDPVEGDEAVPGGDSSSVGDTTTITDTEMMTDTGMMTGTGIMTGVIVLQAGDRIVTQGEFNDMFLRTMRQFAAQTGLPLNPMTLPIFEELRQRFLLQLVLQETLLAEAAQRGIEVQESEIENIVMNARQNFGSDEEFQRALNAVGYADEAEFREAARQESILGMIMDELSQEIDVSDEEIRAFYEENPDLFRTGPGVLLPLEQVSEQIRQVLERAELQEIVGGLQQDAAVEIFTGNLAPLADVLMQQMQSGNDSSSTNGVDTESDTGTLPSIDPIRGSETMTGTSSMTDTSSVTGTSTITATDTVTR